MNDQHQPNGDSPTPPRGELRRDRRRLREQARAESAKSSEPDAIPDASRGVISDASPFAAPTPPTNAEPQDGLSALFAPFTEPELEPELQPTSESEPWQRPAPLIEPAAPAALGLPAPDFTPEPPALDPPAVDWSQREPFSVEPARPVVPKVTHAFDPGEPARRTPAEQERVLPEVPAPLLSPTTVPQPATPDAQAHPVLGRLEPRVRTVPREVTVLDNVALVLAILLPPVGFVVALIAMSKARRLVGWPSRQARVAAWIAAVLTVALVVAAALLWLAGLANPE